MKYQFIELDEISLRKEFSSLPLFAQQLLSSIPLSNDQLDQLFHPTSLLCEEQPVLEMLEFLKDAKQKNEKIIICGDYDCDGVCATSLMVLVCQSMGIEYGFYIPNRIVEGYGLNENTVIAAHQKGYQRIVCVDNGVSAHPALQMARQLEVKVAIVDHHVISEPPQCDVLLHPDVLSDYFHSMCGGGLVYLLCEHLEVSPLMMGLACIATIGDMMPLWGKNREIVIHGLACLNLNRIRAIDLLHEQKTYTATSIAFSLVPKINAVGRLADRANVNNVVRYFTVLDDKECNNFANQINELNKERKLIGKQTTFEAAKMVEDKAMIILQSDRFHEGLVGIVAGQLSNQYHKPALVLANRDGILKGSARSQSISLHDLFSSLNPDLYEKFGGHDHAAGIELTLEQFDDFKEAVYQNLESMNFEDHTLVQAINVDVAQIDVDAIERLHEYEPFGQGFKLPIVALKGQAKAIRLGQAGYKWQIDQIEIVYFGPEKFSLQLQDYLFIGTLSMSEYRGKRICQLKADDILHIS